MSLALLQLILGLSGGLAQSLIPGKNGEKIGQVTSALGLLLGQADSFLQDEAKLRGIPVEQLRATLLAELDKSIPQTAQNIQDRIDRINATPDEATNFLKRAVQEDARIVSSGDLHTEVIVEAQADKRFWVDPETGLGWALIPWEISTMKDRKREADYFSRNQRNQMPV